MADEWAFWGLIGLFLLGGPAARRFAQQPDPSFEAALPPTVRPRDDTGGTPVPATTERMVPDPATDSSATVSPYADKVGIGLANFSDLRLTANEVLAAGTQPLSGEFVGAFTEGTVVVNVPVPGAGYQRIRILPYWTTIEGARQALADAALQQQTYPLGDPLWVHYEALKTAAQQFIGAQPTGSAWLQRRSPSQTYDVFLPDGRVFWAASVETDDEAEYQEWVNHAVGVYGNAWRAQAVEDRTFNRT